MQQNDEIKLTITALDHFGRGISKDNGNLYFVEGALHNETVIAKITKINKKYINAKTVSIVKMSKERVKSECQYYDVCGGCDLMHMNYQKQLEFKENKVKEILKKFAKLDTINPNKIISGPEFNYRNKITLQVKNNKFGLYKKASNDIVEIDQCLLVNEEINRIISKLKQIDLTDISKIIIRHSQYANDTMLIFEINQTIDEKTILQTFENEVNSIYLKYHGDYQLIFGKTVITEKLRDYQFNILPDSFFQVNSDTCLKLYDLIKEKGDHLLELYSGVSSIGIYLSSNFRKVTSVEINKQAYENALENVKVNKISNVEVFNDKSELFDLNNNYTHLLIDPPRSGLEFSLIKKILNSNIKNLIYISCDPATLARDLCFLKDKYIIKQITPVDMFPNTNHVETVVEMIRIDLN